MSKEEILIEVTTADGTRTDTRVIDAQAVKLSLQRLSHFVSQIIPDGGTGLALEEVSMPVRITESGEVVLVGHQSSSGGLTMTLHFRRRAEGFVPVAALVPTLSFASLEELLRVGKWREANIETWRLLCQALQKPKDSAITAADLEQLPCAVIQQMDALWVKHSKGRFGFSVQQRITSQVVG
ncbi:MAG: hypothetical protein HC919_11060 [Oscillatoriales cyanobacterium SM2_2_1]|nr:hypothetical protein [Oscillatoriales cyanobacterium SM2_2_1]